MRDAAALALSDAGRAGFEWGWNLVTRGNFLAWLPPPPRPLLEGKG